MRIEKDQLIGALLAIKARRFFQRERNAEFVMDILNDFYPELSQEQVQRTWGCFLAEGYIEFANEWDGKTWYRTTTKGNTLANASAAKPITRKTAETRLQEFLKRVEQVNQNNEWAFKVARVALFGSMLTDVSQVNDVDLAVELTARLTDKDAHRAQDQQRIQLALSNGRRFGNIVEELYWPRQEIYLFLKARSRVFSLHEFQELAQLNIRDFKMLFGTNPI